MNSFQNNFDSLEQVIFDEGLQIEALSFYKDLNLMLIILNTKAVLQQSISDYPRLSNATDEELKNFEIIGGGTGLHWPSLDEDLSLKGFLQKELRNVVRKVPSE